MIPVLGPVDLVVVAGVDARECDVDVLTGIAGRAASTPTAADTAAEVLVGIAASRPFPADNLALAWLATTVQLRLAGYGVSLSADRIAGLVRDAGSGVTDERAVTTVLATHLVRCGRLRRLGRWLVSRPGPSPAGPTPSPATPARRPVAAGIDWAPVVRGPGTSMLAIVEAGAVALVPTDGGSYRLLAVDTVAASDLVGTWASLVARGQPIGEIASHHVWLNGGCIDWRHAKDVLAAA